MKKAITGSAAAVGIILGSVVAVMDMQDISIDASIRAAPDYRLALIGSDCSAVAVKCGHKYKINSDLCMCMTEEVATLPDEVTDIDTLPVSKHYKFLVCENKADTTNRFARWYPVNEGPLASEWRCETIHNKGVKEKSVRNAKGSLLSSLEQRCCSPCSGECYVKPGEWGMCPYCRLDNNCQDYCP